METLARAGAIVAVAVLAACSPEATRTRDGGPGADVGNAPRVVVPAARPDPRPADSSLWPGKNPAPVDRLAHGDAPPLPKP